MNAQYIDCPHCKIHQGMKKCTENTIEQVKQGLATLKISKPHVSDYQVLLTGTGTGTAYLIILLIFSMLLFPL